MNASTSNAPKIWILSRLMDEIYKSCRHHIILIHALISILIKCKQRRRRWCWWWWYLCFSLFKYKYRVVNVAAIEGKNEMEMNGDSQFKFDSSTRLYPRRECNQNLWLTVCDALFLALLFQIMIFIFYATMVLSRCLSGPEMECWATL